MAGAAPRAGGPAGRRLPAGLGRAARGTRQTGKAISGASAQESGLAPVSCGYPSRLVDDLVASIDMVLSHKLAVASLLALSADAAFVGVAPGVRHAPQRTAVAPRMEVASSSDSLEVREHSAAPAILNKLFRRTAAIRCSHEFARMADRR